MKLQQIHRPSCVAMEKDLRKMNLNARVNDSMLGKVRFTATANIIINYTFFLFLSLFLSFCLGCTQSYLAIMGQHYGPVVQDGTQRRTVCGNMCPCTGALQLTFYSVCSPVLTTALPVILMEHVGFRKVLTLSGDQL